jgi:hypothetical protein
MTLALGDDCELHIGQPTPRSKRLSERSGKVRKLRMRSGDALFFDGGSIPHRVVRIVRGTGPEWWQGAQVKNKARCGVVFREQEEDFYENKIKTAKLKEKKQTAPVRSAAGGRRRLQATEEMQLP